jgi:enoyl-CoA hydratase/carnithine racemase
VAARTGTVRRCPPSTRPDFGASRVRTRINGGEGISPEDIRADQAEAYGYIDRAALPDVDLAAFVEGLAARVAKFDKWAIANTKRLVNTSLPPDVELGAGWDACIASLGRPAAQEGIKALMARGFHKPGDVENRLGYYLGQIAR